MAGRPIWGIYLKGLDMNLVTKLFNSGVTIIVLTFVAGTLLVMCDCTAGQQDGKTAASTVADANAPPGKVVFEKNCIRCHPYGKAGKGPNLSKKKLTPEIVRRQVRKGGLFMPKFPEKSISNEELEQLAEFVPTLSQKK